MDSLGVSDIIHQRIMRTQQMSLLGKFFLSISKHRILFDDKCLVQISCAYSISVVYQPPIAISIHGQVAQVEKISIEWPKSSHRYLNLHGTLMIYKFQYFAIVSYPVMFLQMSNKFNGKDGHISHMAQQNLALHF